MYSCEDSTSKKSSWELSTVSAPQAAKILWRLLADAPSEVVFLFEELATAFSFSGVLAFFFWGDSFEAPLHSTHFCTCKVTAEPADSRSPVWKHWYRRATDGSVFDPRLIFLPFDLMCWVRKQIFLAHSRASFTEIPSWAFRTVLSNCLELGLKVKLKSFSKKFSYWLTKKSGSVDLSPLKAPPPKFEDKCCLKRKTRAASSAVLLTRPCAMVWTKSANWESFGTKHGKKNKSSSLKRTCDCQQEKQISFLQKSLLLCFFLGCHWTGFAFHCSSLFHNILVLKLLPKITYI